MTTPSSIDPAQFLHTQLADPSSDLLRALSAAFVNTLMSAEADAICGAPYGQSARSGSTPVPVPAPGVRHPERRSTTGTLDVAIPKLRSATTSRTGCWSGVAARRRP
jgi:putative transposase